MYARSILHFEPEYYVALGMAEGSVGLLLQETERALRLRNERARHCAKRQKNTRKGKEPARAISLSDSDSDSDAGNNFPMSEPI